MRDLLQQGWVRELGVDSAAELGDKVALAALRETGRWMGMGLASLANILNRERVILGGPMSVAQAYLLPAIRRTVKRRAWYWVQECAEIVIAAHGPDATVRSVVATVYRSLLNEPRAGVRWATIGQ